MRKLQFKASIKASKATVYNTMLGKETFKQWTAVFNPSSVFEGSWEKGAKILFIGVDAEGKQGGMIGRIKENIINEFVSIEYIGIVDGEQELYDGPASEGWIGAHENYTFDEQNGVTSVVVDVDVEDSMSDYFEDTFPQALNKLKEICER